MEIVKYEFPIIGDERGSLVAIEQLRNIPFEIRRVYYIFDIKDNLPRGFHAHKELEQALICVNGSCKVKMDDGYQKKIITLDKPNKGLFVDKMVWHEMFEFSSDCVLMVLANGFFNENDYIRDYGEFIKENLNKKN